MTEESLLVGRAFEVPVPPSAKVETLLYGPPLTEFQERPVLRVSHHGAPPSGGLKRFLARDLRRRAKSHERYEVEETWSGQVHDQAVAVAAFNEKSSRAAVRRLITCVPELTPLGGCWRSVSRPAIGPTAIR